MLNKVRAYIEKHRLLNRDSLHIVALSGGADSVCLLRMMKQMGYRVEAAHCNFKLRGEESNRDESFCRSLCETLGVELHVVHFDTREYAMLHSVSIEMAARELRYGYFYQLAEALGAEDIIVAHHEDDNIETMLINLLRGTGITGLEGIRPEREIVKRPLLCLTRKEIECYLKAIGQEYITDSSNLVADVMRNKVRLNLIPMLEEIMDGAKQNITRTMENLSEAAKVVRFTIEQGIARCVEKPCDSHSKSCGLELKIRIDDLMREPSPEMLLFEVLRQYGINPSQISEIHRLATEGGAEGRRVWHTNTHTVSMERDSILVGHEEDVPTIVIPESGTYVCGAGRKIEIRTEEKTEDFSVSKSPLLATLDASKVRMPLTMRKIQAGDRFVPYGMRGMKLISDYMADRKKNYFERQQQTVLCDADGEVVWLTGERVAQKAACNEKTIKVLSARYIYDE